MDIEDLSTVSPLLIYLRGCVNLGYYILIVPFKIIHEPHGSVINCMAGFKIHTNPYQKVLCGIVYISVMCHQFYFSPEVRSLMPSTFGPFSYLTLFRKVLSIWLVICAIIIFWKRQGLFIKIVQTVQTLQFTSTNTKKTTLLIKLVILLCYCWYIYDLPMELFIEISAKGSIDLNATAAINRLYFRAQRLFLTPPEEIEPIQFHSVSILQAFQCFLYFILYFFASWIQMYLEMLVLLTIFLCWHMTTLFEKWYKQLSQESVSDPELLRTILHQYDELKMVLRMTNKLVGPAIILSIVLYLPIYAVYAGLITIKQSFTTHSLILIFFHYIIYFLQISLASEIHRKGSEFIRWASSPRFHECIHLARLTSLSMDLNSNQIALKGGGCFSLTYRFLSSILGVMITYAVLVVQFQEGRFVPVDGGNGARSRNRHIILETIRNASDMIVNRTEIEY